MVGIIIVTIVIAAFWHLMLDKFWISSIGSTFTTIFLVIVILTGAGHPPFYTDGWFLEFLGPTIVVLIISLLIGIPFKINREKNNEKI